MVRPALLQENLPEKTTANLRCTLEDVELARLALENLIRGRVEVNKEAIALSVIVDEVVSNVIRHAYIGLTRDGPITVEMTIDEGLFTLIVTDEGCAFNPASLPEPKAPDRPGIGGRGLILVHGLSDSIENERTRGVNRTTVKKYISTSKQSKGTMTTGLTIEEIRGNKIATVVLSGRIDSANAANLTDHLTGLVGSGYIDLTLDLKDLAYLTSAGFRTLLVASDAAEDQNGSLRLTGLSDVVRELFEMSGLDQAFDIE